MPREDSGQENPADADFCSSCKGYLRWEQTGYMASVPVVEEVSPPAETPAEHQLKLEFDELAAKATAAIEMVNGMEERARDAGSTLNPDLIAQRILIQSTMDEAQESLRAKDMDALRERLKRVRGHIEKLYRML